jgi:hypothetical protein
MRRTTIDRRWAALLALASILSVAPGLRAQSTSPEDLATARSLANEAAKKKSLDPKGAVELFDRAFTLAPSPMVRLETARLHATLHELIESESDLREAMGITKKGEPASWKTARATAADELTKIEGRAPFVIIKVPDDRRADVKVSIDGKPIPAASLGVRRVVNPGTRVITAEAPGYKPVRKEITLQEKQVQDVPLELEVDPAAAAAAASAAPAESAAPPPPPATTAEPPPPPPVQVVPETPPARSGYGLAIGGFTTAGVLFGLGTVSGLLAKRQFDSFKDLCVDKHCPPDKKSEGSAAGVYAAISTGAFALGGGFVVVGIVGLFTGGRPIARTGALPTPGFDGRTFSLSGRF